MRPALEQRVELLARVLADEHVDVALAVAEQLLDEMAPDEARRARDEIAQESVPSGRNPARSLYPGARAAPALARGEPRGARRRVGERGGPVARLDGEAVGQRQAEAVVCGAAVGEHRLPRGSGQPGGGWQAAGG